jgi:hypothetical protein
MKVVRRTFEAKRFPKGSKERARLNADSLTSEYLPTYQYVLRGDNGEYTPYCYHTKVEAQEAARAKEIISEFATS